MTVCIVYVSYYLVKALKSITNLSDCLENTTQDIKEKIQTKTLTLIPAFLVAIAVKIMKQASYFATKKKRG
ncbi:hypothetical protein KKE78_04970 [Patescibacteria group bacterium]|nr:hypothetical protein [Patescibacteria group bacterium]